MANLVTILGRLWRGLARLSPAIGETLPAFAAACPTFNVGEGTRDRYVAILTAFACWLGDRATLDHITTAQITAYHAALVERGQAARTRRLTLSAIRSFCRWAMREQLLSADPTIGVAWPKIPKTKARYLRLAELRTLIRVTTGPRPRGRGESAWIWERNLRLFQLMLYGGLRISEACALRWECVDLIARTLLVRDGKGDKDRELPMHGQLLATLERVPAAERVGPVCPTSRGSVATKTGRERKAMTEAGADKIFSRWLPEQGVEGLTAHRLRHTCAWLMRHGGADLKDIQEVLGHESLETTEGYLGSDPERLRLAVDVLPDWAELATYQPPRLRQDGMRGRKVA